MTLSTWFRYTAALAAVAILCTPASAADPIAYWNFNDLGITATGACTPGTAGCVGTTIGATTGTGTLSLTGYGGTVDDFTGTSVNSIPVNTPGEESLSLIGTAGNGTFLQFEFSMTGRTNLGVSYATQATGTGFNSNQWSFSTDGTNFTDFGPVIAPATAYSLTGPLVTTGLDNAATAFLRYTLNGATGAGGNNRLDNVRLEFNATPAPPPNPASLPQPGDVVFGLNNSNAATTLELVRGPATASGGVRFPGPWSTQNFVQSVEFDNLNGQSHNARGNLLGVNFAVGGGANSGAIYSFATQGTIPAPAPQVIGNTGATDPLGHDGSLTQSNLAGLSVAPDNSKIAVVGEDTGAVIVYDYTAGDTMGSGAALSGGRQTSPELESRILVGGSTQGTAWLDNDTVLAFSSIGDLYEVDVSPTVLSPTLRKTVTTDAVGGTPFIGSNVSSIAYNPEVSDYVYTLYSGFAAGTSVTHLYVLDPANNYNQLADINLSGSSQTGREIALDEDGNLFISAFDSTITFIPASAAQNPGTLTDNSSVFWYQSTAAATSFVGFDIGFGESVVLTGDYNGDGKVDAADYVVWRNDPASFGGAQGYTDWAANFGSGGPGSGSAIGDAVAVPEPMGLTLLLIGVLGLWHAGRRA